jgi:ATPase family associated with various cellular activities (AAA)
MMRATANPLRALFYFAAGAAAATALRFYSHVKEAKKVRKETSGRATVERLDGRADIPPIQTIPVELQSLEELRASLALLHGGSLRVLLQGPPSSGKTRFIRSYVSHLGVPALFVRVHALLVDHPALLASRIEDLSERAEKLSPCIVVLDGLDEASAEVISLMQQHLWNSTKRLLWIGTSRTEISGFESVLRIS